MLAVRVEVSSSRVLVSWWRDDGDECMEQGGTEAWVAESSGVHFLSVLEMLSETWVFVSTVSHAVSSPSWEARADTKHDMARLRAELDAQRSEFALEQQRLEVELCEEQEQAQVADTRLVTARREIEAAEEAQEVQKQFLDSIAEAL